MMTSTRILDVRSSVALPLVVKDEFEPRTNQPAADSDKGAAKRSRLAIWKNNGSSLQGGRRPS